MYKKLGDKQLFEIGSNIYTVLCSISVVFAGIHFGVIFYTLTSNTIYLLTCLVSGTLPSIKLILLILLYSGWYYYDRKSPERGGYRTNKFITLLRTKLFILTAHYFPIVLHFPGGKDDGHAVTNVSLKENQSYIIGYHPHGVLPVGAIIPFTRCTEMLRPFIPHSLNCIKFATVPFNTKFPIWRELLLASGFIHSSFRSCLVYLCNNNEDDKSEKKGNVLVIAVGGSREMLEARNGNCTLIISPRKGIFRLALLTGSSLIPVFGFNENEVFKLYEGYRWIKWIQDWSLKRFNFTIPCAWGRYFYGLLPAKMEINVVFGDSISVEKKNEEEITEELVEELKEKYINEVRRLYEENVQKYGDPKVPLIIK